jgi:hypothetical protein
MAARWRTLTRPHRQCSNVSVIARSAAAWISTLVVAIVVALAVPVSQLRTVLVVKTCCCPDPDHCHCPVHSDSSSDTTMRNCHNTERMVIAPEAPAFAAPVIALAPAPVAIVRTIAPAIPAPHQSPPPIRPDAPS